MVKREYQVFLRNKQTMAEKIKKVRATDPDDACYKARQALIRETTMTELDFDEQWSVVSLNRDGIKGGS